jgi:predicted ATPase
VGREREVAALAALRSHLVEAAPLVADLLASCRDLTILATSRSLLGISGEYDVTVPP